MALFFMPFRTCRKLGWILGRILGFWEFFGMNENLRIEDFVWVEIFCIWGKLSGWWSELKRKNLNFVCGVLVW